MENCEISTDKEDTSKSLEVKGVKISQLDDIDEDEEDTDYSLEDDLNQEVEDSDTDDEEGPFSAPLGLGKPGFDSGATVCLAFLYKVIFFLFFKFCFRIKLS